MRRVNYTLDGKRFQSIIGDSVCDLSAWLDTHIYDSIYFENF